VKNERTNEERTAITGDRGEFLVAGLRPSSYTVTTRLNGFSANTVPDMQLVVGKTLSLDLTIKPASISESVTVESLNEALVDTTSASIGVNVGLREVGTLPINGRQLSQLYLQAPAHRTLVRERSTISVSTVALLRRMRCDTTVSTAQESLMPHRVWSMVS
jgi:hypothetical protein